MKLKEIVFKALMGIFGPSGFGKMLLRSVKSPTYARFCEKVYGRNLCQFNMVDEDQLETLVKSMQPLETLDLGCGIGVVTEYLSDQLNAMITGVDFAPLAITSALERTRTKADRLVFKVMNLNKLDFKTKQFEQVIAIDSLYFVRDLDQTVKQIKTFLKPGGKLLAFYSSRASKGAREKADKTKLAKALASNGFKFKAQNFQTNEESIWQRTEQVAEELRSDFEAEGAKDVYMSRKAEAKKNLEWQRQGIMARYLYIATRP
jgi:ubiquinone/menaquinone biosynthesis C-methylase UbiE